MSLVRRLLVIGAVAVAGAVVSSPTATAAVRQASLSVSPDTRFPARELLLDLPARRELNAEDIEVLENGSGVLDLQVVPASAARSVGAMLVIDASNSMHGKPIRDAMAAARSFASRRRPNQSLGVVLFAREPRVLLAPTTDAARIDAALADVPVLSKGTQLYDATDFAIDQLRHAGIRRGSVVVLSDGADAGSATGPADLQRVRRSAHVRLFAVGLRSPSYDAMALRTVADAGSGTYAEVASSGRLPAIFAALGQRLADEYLISYRSRAPLGANVLVTAEAVGVDGIATASYRVPTAGALPTAGGGTERASFWTSRAGLVIVSAVVSVLLAFAVFSLLTPRRRSLRERIGGFTDTRGLHDVRPAVSVLASNTNLLQRAERAFGRVGRWKWFEEEVEIARIEISAVQLVLIVAVGALGLAWLGIAADRAFIAPIVLIATLPALAAVVAVLAGKQRRRYTDQLPDNLQAIASAMRAGHSFIGALALLVDDAPEPSRREFARVVRDEQLGVAPEVTLDEVARRMRSSETQYIGLVAALQREAGGNTAEVFDRVAATVRERGEVRRMVRTLTAQGRIGGGVISAVPLFLALALSVLRPGYFDPMLAEPLGIVLIAAGGLMMVCGWAAIAKLVNIKV